MSDDSDNPEVKKSCSTCRFVGKGGGCDWDIPIWMEEFFEDIISYLGGSSLFAPAQRAKGYPPLGHPPGWNCRAWRKGD